ncbi:MAG: twin transmembrane helix small protein [SAR116 cluster bacterium]|nr:MAG: twin transmembrane helix small protein [SAR116 cluster bacterium]|tara:strand:+ start:830 stop:1033 length:204 start_codon:yes stop_codon:yes gene_type:complete
MTIDQIILAASLLIVAGILGWGVLTMARGGSYNVKNSNRIMRYRIVFQALALVVILVLMWLRRDGNA